MKKDLFSSLDHMTLATVTAPLLLDLLRTMTEQVFRLGIETGRCERSFVVDLHGALKPIVVNQMAALL